MRKSGNDSEKENSNFSKVWFYKHKKANGQRRNTKTFNKLITRAWVCRMLLKTTQY